MTEIILSAAISIDGYLDDASPSRLRLSSPEDWAAVGELRRKCDAILVGGETVRRDDPSLREVPLRVVVSRSGNIPAGARIFGSGEVLVLSGRDFTAREIITELEKHGVERLLVEGGAQMLKLFLSEGMADRLRLAVAPILVGNGVRFPSVEGQKMALQKVEQLGQTAVMYFVRNEEVMSDCKYLERAIEVSRQSPPSPTAYRVGAVIVTRDGHTFEGYTHETGPANHAEEEAIAKALDAGINLAGSTIYTSMEPCSTRASKLVSCSELIIHHGFSRVVFALREPSLFVTCTGAENLRKAGIEVVHIAELAEKVRKINRHLLNN